MCRTYSEWKAFSRPNFLEVLKEFPCLELSAAFLLSQLPLLKPRLYSVSSSPELYPHELHLTVSVVNYHTQDPTIPTILIGAGSGIAPFCSFWQQHFHEIKHTGLEKSPRMLVFGCCGAVMVHLYKEETFNMKENGMLKSITPAYSHQPGHSKI
ncbi:hypothetical protein KOW79_014459 [Hemibagrus wyckioides]|uniref:nitric-oxide synthase (NADPH) n=1 Tax=Hemibagrus wyckioides TaxID=337641 RepID=A0A9D3NF82_9TELE|nr:hypothetical protein KOW79_014459 [Hemibagrus wyckioides]